MNPSPDAPSTTVVFNVSPTTETHLHSTTLTSVFPSAWTNFSTATTTSLNTTISTNIYNTTTTTLLPIPVAGQLPLTARLLGEAQGSVTFAIQDCTTPSSLCMWVEPLTVTAAPGTARIDDSNYWKALGQFDCTWDAKDAQYTWTLGAYPSSELVGDTKDWVTAPALSSVTLTLSGQSLRNFVNVTVIKLVTDVVTSVSSNTMTNTVTSITTGNVTDISTSMYNVTTTEFITRSSVETLTPSTTSANYWNSASRSSQICIAWRALGCVIMISMVLLSFM